MVIQSLTGQFPAMAGRKKMCVLWQWYSILNNDTFHLYTNSKNTAANMFVQINLGTILGGFLKRNNFFSQKCMLERQTLKDKTPFSVCLSKAKAQANVYSGGSCNLPPSFVIRPLIRPKKISIVI